MKLASTHGIETSVETNDHLSAAANEIQNRSALCATENIVEKVEAFASANKKKVLYVLSFPATTIAQRINEGRRWDQSFVDFLNRRGLPYVDLMEAHLADFAKYKLTAKEYLQQYFIGHYNPRGNLFCAFALKDKLVEFLDPKPSPYRADAGVLR